MLNHVIRTINFLHSSRDYYYSCLSTYWVTEDLHAISLFIAKSVQLFYLQCYFFLNELEWMNNGIKLLHLFSIGLYPWRTILLLCEIYKRICAPTLLKTFRRITQDTLILFYLALSITFCIIICANNLQKRSKPTPAYAQEYYVELLFNALFTKDVVTWVQVVNTICVLWRSSL